MSRWMFIGFGLVATLGILVVWACTQEDGARCQLHSDCASGFCCKAPYGTEYSTDGVCKANQAACDEIWGGDGGAETDTPRDDATAEAEAEAEAEEEAEVEEEAEAEAEAEEEAEAEAEEEADIPDVEEEVPTDSAAETD